MQRIDVDGVGEVELLIIPRSRQRTLKVSSRGRVRVVTSPADNIRDIRAFVASKREWIEKTRNELRSKAPQQIVFEVGKTYDFRCFKLIISESNTTRQTYSHFSENAETGCRSMQITCPSGFGSAETPEFQKFVRKNIDAVLNYISRKTFPQKLEALAKAKGFSYDRVDFRNMKSQWGSCSSSGRICLNIQLARLRPELIELVMLHELCHTQELNHADSFHALLYKVTEGRSIQLEKELRKETVMY